jgi:hypothetical protein
MKQCHLASKKCSVSHTLCSSCCCGWQVNTVDAGTFCRQLCQHLRLNRNVVDILVPSWFVQMDDIPSRAASWARPSSLVGLLLFGCRMKLPCAVLDLTQTLWPHLLTCDMPARALCVSKAGCSSQSVAPWLLTVTDLDVAWMLLDVLTATWEKC